MEDVLMFDSQNESFKRPFGAVKAGEPAFFCLRVPAADATEPRMLVQLDNGPVHEIVMERRGETGADGVDVFCAQFVPPAPGLYFYWFDLWKDYRKLYRGPRGRAVEMTGGGQPFQLTVYDPAFTTPAGVHGGVMYQIFPDRFFEGEPGRLCAYPDRIYHANKKGEPYFWPTEKPEGYLTKDYYGGDFAGIGMKLPYLQSLGVNWVYLNPIFEAHSNHRYNTADYLNADPYLGTNEEFEQLCKEAAKLDIKIILDGVFSHTGSDSIYFNREGHYPDLGAWQSAQSPYRGWYHFHPDGTYDSWWGFETLPACNKQNRSYRDFICGDGGVVDTWLRRGAAGFRLDVADELPDDFIAEIRRAVKAHGDDRLLVGEVWEDASNKTAYGVRRKYFAGAELDGVMNYPFRTAILRFLGDRDGAAFADAVMGVAENYPPPALAACTTHLSTHDTERAVTALAGEPVDGHDRDWQSGHRLTPEQYAVGVAKLRLATVLQFTLPGVPCVYYGDEIPMQGYKDPFNRAYFDWDAPEYLFKDLITRLSALRKGSAAFAEGGIRFTLAEGGLVAFERCGQGGAAAVAVNCTGDEAHVLLLGEDVAVGPMGFAWRQSGA